jgi:hypothetical protein
MPAVTMRRVRYLRGRMPEEGKEMTSKGAR